MSEVQVFDGDGTIPPEIKELLRINDRLKDENTILRRNHNIELESRNREYLRLGDKIAKLEQKLGEAKLLAESRLQRLLTISHTLYSREDFREIEDFRSIDDPDCHRREDDEDDES